mmetsp:Transcript_6508/g.23185  ORF Transcript_6508/g.23185 Transcript_6508/m.23185 type:complete len:236 (+) Transcript_6508:1501-2208(+)
MRRDDGSASATGTWGRRRALARSAALTPRRHFAEEHKVARARSVQAQLVGVALDQVRELGQADGAAAVVVGLLDDVQHVRLAHDLAERGQRVAQLLDRDLAAAVAVDDLEDEFVDLLGTLLGAAIVKGHPVEEVFELDRALVAHVHLPHHLPRHGAALVRHAEQLEQALDVLGAHGAVVVAVKQAEHLLQLHLAPQVRDRVGRAVHALSSVHHVLRNFALRVGRRRRLRLALASP